jgi:hypothetical protein
VLLECVGRDVSDSVTVNLCVPIQIDRRVVAHFQKGLDFVLSYIALQHLNQGKQTGRCAVEVATHLTMAHTAVCYHRGLTVREVRSEMRCA